MAATSRHRLLIAVAMAACCVVAIGHHASGQAQQTLTIRGHAQSLRVYGTRGGRPVIVSSGDGGWLHLGPHVAEVLAAKGFFVVGFDARAYLTSFTCGGTTLRVEDEPGDYRILIDFAARGTTEKPILIGVSEGAGLSVLAASDPSTRGAIAGVIGLGLSDVNELGWRWADALIYLTHRVPKEPTFSAAAIVGRVAPVPLGVIYSAHDEFVPLAEVHHVFEHAHEPKQLWIIDAANHRFSNNLATFDRRLLQAIAWVARAEPK